MDAGNLLKPMLARGELHCIGATTLDEYRKHIEKDAALERRFQPVLVDQPTVEDTISILRGLRERYEVHHGVRIKDAALVAAAVLSNRYISDRFLPDKAIDLVDEAAAKLRTEIDSMPADLDEILRRIMQLEIEREALKKETDSASRERLGKLEREIADLKVELLARCRRNGRTRKKPFSACEAFASNSSKRKLEIEKAERAYDLNKAAELTIRQTSRAGSPACRDRQQQAPALASSKRRSTRKTSPRSSAAGRVYPYPSCSKARRKSFSILERNSTSVSLARMKPSRPSPRRSSAPGRV